MSYGLYFMESLKMFLKLVIVAKQYSALNSSICLFLLSCVVNHFKGQVKLPFPSNAVFLWPSSIIKKRLQNPSWLICLWASWTNFKFRPDCPVRTLPKFFFYRSGPIIDPFNRKLSTAISSYLFFEKSHSGRVSAHAGARA